MMIIIQLKERIQFKLNIKIQIKVINKIIYGIKFNKSNISDQFKSMIK